MPFRPHLAFLATLAFASALTPPALTQPALIPSLSSDLLPIRDKHGLPALAAAVVRNGEIIAAGAVGVRVLGGNIPVTLDDRFHLGSDTKSMTATLAGMMVDQGKLKWTSTIGEVLGADVPGLNPKLAAVRLEQLLSHSSGIPTDTDELLKIYFNTDAFQYNLSALRINVLKAWRDHEPKVPEGSPFQYANLGYIIAGAMIEKVAGDPWENLIVTRIFAPLDLKTAGLGAQATTGKIDAPVGHQIGDDGKITPMLWGAAADLPPMVGPAGTAHMSILDFARWGGWNAGVGKRGPALRLCRHAQAHPGAACENAGDQEPTARHADDRRLCIRLGHREVRVERDAGTHPQRLERDEHRQNPRRYRQGFRHRDHDEFSGPEGGSRAQRGRGEALQAVRAEIGAENMAPAFVRVVPPPPIVPKRRRIPPVEHHRTPP